jgi:hypothetical protein
VAHLQVPQLFDRGDLGLGYATLATWAIDVAVMALAALLAVLAIIHGAAACRASQGTSAVPAGISG